MPFIKADLHMHTHHSGDCRTTPEELVTAACAAGLGIIGVTDHNSVQGGIDCRAAANGRLIVLAGQEVKAAEGEVIVFGLDTNLPPGRPAAETCAAAKKAGGLVMIPHPFERRRSHIAAVLDDLLPFIDLFETFNSHSISPAANAAAADYARIHRLPTVANSDAHRASELGRTFTTLETRPLLTEQDAITALQTAPRTVTTAGGTLPAFLRRKLRLWYIGFFQASHLLPIYLSFSK